MHRICFVCLGNICRSPMAEYMMKEKVRKLGLEKEFVITSRGTSLEEYGHDIYPPAKEKLEEMQIPYEKHFANRIHMNDYLENDFIIGMEQANISALKSFFPKDSGKIRQLLSRDIADPWYTGDFTKTYEDIEEGLNYLLEEVLNQR